MCGAFQHQFIYHFEVICVIFYVVISPKLNTNFTWIRPASFKLIRFLFNICIILIQNRIINQKLKKKILSINNSNETKSDFLRQKTYVNVEKNKQLTKNLKAF